MKIARIQLPLLDNEGKDLGQEHKALRQQLIATWGGFTAYEGLGGWIGARKKLFHERVAIYDIAMERADVVRLRQLALTYCGLARQESVMIVTPNGDVEFVSPQPKSLTATNSY